MAPTPLTTPAIVCHFCLWKCCLHNSSQGGTSCPLFWLCSSPTLLPVGGQEYQVPSSLYGKFRGFPQKEPVEGVVSICSTVRSRVRALVPISLNFISLLELLTAVSSVSFSTSFPPALTGPPGLHSTTPATAAGRYYHTSMSTRGQS